MIMDLRPGKNGPYNISGVFDATGRKINHCVYVDTETGETIWAKHDENMQLQVGEDGDFILIHETVPVPIRLEWVPEPPANPPSVFDIVRQFFVRLFVP